MDRDEPTSGSGSDPQLPVEPLIYSIIELYTLDNDSQPVIIDPGNVHRKLFNMIEALFNKEIVDWLKKYDGGCLSWHHLHAFYDNAKITWTETYGEKHPYVKVIDDHRRPLFERMHGLRNSLQIHADVVETRTHMLPR